MAFWDPHFHTRPFGSEVAIEPKGGVSVPKFVRTLAGVTTMLGFITAAIGLILSWHLFSAGAAFFVVGMLAMFAIDKLGKTSDRLRWFYYRLAERRNGWDFAFYLENDKGVRAATAVGMDGAAHDAERETSPDPRLRWLSTTIPELLKPTVGTWGSLRIKAGYWGAVKGRPFWLGLSDADVHAALATKANRQDVHGTDGRRATLFALLLAFPLPRDTGLRMTVFPRCRLQRWDVEDRVHRVQQPVQDSSRPCRDQP